MLNAWLRNCGSILAFMKKEIKYTRRETGRKMLGKQGAVEQFLIVCFMNNKIPSHTLKGRTFFAITFAKKFIIQIT